MSCACSLKHAVFPHACQSLTQFCLRSSCCLASARRGSLAASLFFFMVSHLASARRGALVCSVDSI